MAPSSDFIRFSGVQIGTIWKGASSTHQSSTFLFRRCCSRTCGWLLFLLRRASGRRIGRFLNGSTIWFHSFQWSSHRNYIESCQLDASRLYLSFPLVQRPSLRLAAVSLEKSQWTTNRPVSEWLHHLISFVSVEFKLELYRKVLVGRIKALPFFPAGAAPELVAGCSFS